jgi:hypothetical protein
MKILLLTVALLVASAVPATAQFLTPPPAIDRAARDRLTWGNTTVAERLSDSLVAAAALLPCTFDDRSKDCFTKQSLKVATVVGLAEAAKRSIDRERPDGSDAKSFFSMHTALACVNGGASKKRLVLGLALCAGAGYLRIAGKKHWFTDAAVGAGTGLAVAWIQR